MKCPKKITWVARYCRCDILRASNVLTTRITRWTPRDYNKLVRLMSYMLSCKDWEKVGLIRAPMNELRLVIFTDANFEGDHSDM